MPDHGLMRMSAALIPPPPVLEDLAAVVRSVRGHETQLEAVPADLMRMPLGNFGNVGLTDRMALPELATDADVADAAVFLTSDRARAITGQSLLVNAGELMR